MIKCYGCEEEFKSEDRFKWISDDKKKGRCLDCNRIDELLAKMRSETTDPGQKYKVSDNYSFMVNVAEKVICPYCGSIEGPDWENQHHFQGEVGEWEEQLCQSCEETFELEVVISFRRTTRKVATFEEAKQEYEKGGEN